MTVTEIVAGLAFGLALLSAVQTLRLRRRVAAIERWVSTYLSVVKGG